MILCPVCKQLILQCHLLHSSNANFDTPSAMIKYIFRGDFRMKWVDDTHALGVFSSASLGKET